MIGAIPGGITRAENNHYDMGAMFNFTCRMLKMVEYNITFKPKATKLNLMKKLLWQFQICEITLLAFCLDTE